MFKTIIVDDEPQIRKGLRTIIPWEDYGFVIVGEAADGLEALELFKETVPDLVITDIKMPRMGGIELSKHLSSCYPEIQIMILSGYNDFVYAKEALRHGVIDYLLKPVDPEEMSQALETIYTRLWSQTQESLKENAKAKSLKGFFLSKLIRGEIFHYQSAAAVAYEINLKGSQFCMMIVSIDRYGEFLLSLSGQEIGLKKFAVGNVIEEIVDDSGYLFEISEQQFGVLLIEPQEMMKDALRDLAKRIVDCIGRYVKESVTVGVGSVVRLPEEIKSSYTQASKALEMKFFFDSETVFVHRPEEFEVSISSFRWDDSGLLQAIREGNRDQITVETELLIESFELNYAALDKLKYFVMTTIIHLAKLTEEHHGDWQTFYTGKFSEMEHIIGHGIILRLKQFLNKISLEICQYVESAKTRKADNRIREIVEHIEQNYMRELNLKELSKIFYINTVYLGQLFKKETGEYFNDYINKIRVKQAYQLLEQTHFSTSEIAERVGYKYVDHFYRWFKLIYGMNPGEIRKRTEDKTE